MTIQQIAKSEPLFNTVLEALFSAYRAETISLCKISSMFADMSGGTVRLSPPLSRFDTLTQGVFTRSVASRALTQRLRLVMDAYFTVPVDTLAQRKDLACRLLSFDVWEDLGKDRPRWYLNDVTRSWAGMRPVHADNWWCDHLGVTERTLRNYKHGRANRNQRGAVPVLNGWYSELLFRLEEPFFEAGLV